MKTLQKPVGGVPLRHHDCTRSYSVRSDSTSGSNTRAKMATDIDPEILRCRREHWNDACLYGKYLHKSLCRGQTTLCLSGDSVERRTYGTQYVRGIGRLFTSYRIVDNNGSNECRISGSDRQLTHCGNLLQPRTIALSGS